MKPHESLRDHATQALLVHLLNGLDKLLLQNQVLINATMLAQVRSEDQPECARKTQELYALAASEVEKWRETTETLTKLHSQYTQEKLPK